MNGLAAALISERICGLPEFAAARSAVIASAARACEGKSVPELRALGGLSAELERQIDALPGYARLNFGSKMWPRSVADELRARVPSLRFELQRHLSEVSS